MINLDTHILLFALSGDLRRKEKQILEHQPWCVSAMVFWEITKLNVLGRLNLDTRSAVFADLMRLVHVWPVSPEIAQATAGLDFSSDPADELIAATSLHHDVALLTRDRRMSASRVVPLA